MTLKIRPGAKRSEVKEVERDAAGVERLVVHVNAPPVDGKANAAVMKMLAKRWGLPVSRLSLVSGAAARIKVIEIADGDADLVHEITVIEQGLRAETKGRKR
ncbi:MAG: DUF167 domain-containing protein [Alphaproteobacteria bacterium]